MTTKKAQRHLNNAREDLSFWREQYVYSLRKEAWKNLRGTRLYKEMMDEIMTEMSEAKERIARFERIVK